MPDIEYPRSLREHAHTIPARPEGTNMIVQIVKGQMSYQTTGRITAYYEVVRNDDHDGLVLIAPLAVDDARNAFWIDAGNLVEVPGAHVDSTGYLRIPTVAVEL